MIRLAHWLGTVGTAGAMHNDDYRSLLAALVETWYFIKSLARDAWW